MRKTGIILSVFLFQMLKLYAFDPSPYDVIWRTQSKNSGESMPCGGGDIGLNVWVEKGDILFYLSRSGAFDEINLFPKFGRIRLKLHPNPFSENAPFKQQLKLREGYVEIRNDQASVSVWVDVFRPVVHVQTDSKKMVEAEIFYETWRIADRAWTRELETRASRSYAPTAPLGTKAVVFKDSVAYEGNEVLFYHRNRENTLFDLLVKQQGMESVKDQLFNPLKELTFGGVLYGDNMIKAETVKGEYADIPYVGYGIKSVKPQTRHHARILLHIDQSPSLTVWKEGLTQLKTENKKLESKSWEKSKAWWNEFWNRSYIAINSDCPDAASKAWQVGRNYQVFRYQLGCNAYGKYPTKFNGGLFTYDPVFVDPAYAGITPDHRNWGGGTFTAQNQRLLYWPMLKSGDFDMMPSQFEFYNRLLPTAELRSQILFGHKGANYVEQIEQFGMLCAGDYALQVKGNKDYPMGLEGNQWLEHHWDTQLEFALMIMDWEQFSGNDISIYIPFIESSTEFFYEHYQKEARRNSVIPQTSEGHLILYPGTACETYKVAYNSSATIAGLYTVVKRMLELPDRYLSKEKRELWKKRASMIPPIPFREKNGHKTIAPAIAWSRIQNQEIPQLYPVYPFDMYGIGLPDLEVAVNTWKYGIDVARQRNHISWHQNAIFCARLGLTDEAKELTIKKMEDANRRFPTWWGPGHDWVPDHNWGGSGMIGLQEMLMITRGKKIYLFPAWPKEWNVKFKLHAPYRTTVEGELRDGKLIGLTVWPKEREKDVEVMTIK